MENPSAGGGRGGDQLTPMGYVVYALGGLEQVKDFV